MIEAIVERNVPYARVWKILRKQRQSIYNTGERIDSRRDFSRTQKVQLFRSSQGQNLDTKGNNTRNHWTWYWSGASACIWVRKWRQNTPDTQRHTGLRRADLPNGSQNSAEDGKAHRPQPVHKHWGQPWSPRRLNHLLKPRTFIYDIHRTGVWIPAAKKRNQTSLNI